jgi:hypothetical protein
MIRQAISIALLAGSSLLASPCEATRLCDCQPLSLWTIYGRVAELTSESPDPPFRRPRVQCGLNRDALHYEKCGGRTNDPQFDECARTIAQGDHIVAKPGDGGRRRRETPDFGPAEWKATVDLCPSAGMDVRWLPMATTIT